ncbi:GNAT family N-acetyltransferase [Pedococcus sp. 5OH_020]|uniref:GNAT family N-acetyltransferase n=1 Tax=Pedococcus sp. 5OH_020 TaxID=2989814 RepID=UPI0022E9DDEF|nr:GNAT family N-acetyltransferase [Pedococcus sp. 5OH_020]
MQLRDASQEDLPGLLPAFLPVFRAVVADGETYAYPETLSDSEIGALWFERPPGRTVVALDDTGALLGSAKMGPNRPGRGAHIATASFMVAERARGQGVGRALAEDMVRWAATQGYAGIQFNAVVQTNRAAVLLWQALGFEILGTVPGAFESSRHGRVGLHVMFLPLAPA